MGLLILFSNLDESLQSLSTDAAALCGYFIHYIYDVGTFFPFFGSVWDQTQDLTYMGNVLFL